MASNMLIQSETFNSENIVYSKPETNTIPGQKLSYQKIKIGYKNGNDVGDLMLESPPNLLCWGLTEQHDMVSGQLIGYQLPICLWSKNGPSTDEKAFTDTINELCNFTKQYLVDNRESIGKYDLDMAELKKFNPLYWKMEKGKVVEDKGPTLYAKCMYSKKNDKFGTIFVDENINANVYPSDILNKQCHVKFALKVESIYIGTKISLQVKLAEVLFRPKETVLRSLLAPSAVIKDVSIDSKTEEENVEEEVVDEEEEEEIIDEEETEEVEEEEEEEEEEPVEEIKPVPVKKVEPVKAVRKTRGKKTSA